jgi:hypothetical protein
MTEKEAMAMALEALKWSKPHEDAIISHSEAITALEERLADPMREVQRLGQEIEQEPVCPECKAIVLYECVACSSNNYPPPQRTEQEPVGYVYSESGVKSAAIQRDLPNGTPLYTHPPQRTWVGLTEQQRNDIEDACEMIIGKPAFDAIEAKLKEKNQ